MKFITRKTGYLYQYSGNPDGEGAADPVESWHRTFKGAQRAKARNYNIGHVYRITGDDTCYEVQA